MDADKLVQELLENNFLTADQNENLKYHLREAKRLLEIAEDNASEADVDSGSNVNRDSIVAILESLD